MTTGIMYAAQPANVRQDLADALAGRAVDLALLVEFDFASGPVRLCNRTVPVIDGKDGHTWTPAPSTANIRDIEGGPENWAPVRIYEMTIPHDLLDEFQGETGAYPDLDDKAEYQGRDATMWLQVLDTGAGASGTDAAIGYPVALHKGTMDRIVVKATRDGIRHELRVEGFLARKGVQGAGLLTARDQKRRHPGDLGYDYVAEVPVRPAVWPDY